jgi:hypothetical protein
MEIILGHLVGDYLLQSDWMALNKKKIGAKGWIPCIIHCLIWTTSMMLFIGKLNIALLLGLFISHLILDRTNLVVWLLNATRIMPNPAMWKVIIVDNTLHLLMVYGLLILI